MDELVKAYALSGPIAGFRWHRFSGQDDRNVTYIYLSSPPIPRVRGESPILYVGKTTMSIARRVHDETHTNNTPGNTQNTNIRLSTVIAELVRLGHTVDTYFTEGLMFSPPSDEHRAVMEILRVWDKRAWTECARGGSAISDFAIEKYLLCHYAAVHLELPPLNSSM